MLNLSLRFRFVKNNFPKSFIQMCFYDEIPLIFFMHFKLIESFSSLFLLMSLLWWYWSYQFVRFRYKKKIKFLLVLHRAAQSTNVCRPNKNLLLLKFLFLQVFSYNDSIFILGIHSDYVHNFLTLQFDGKYVYR